MPRYNEFRRLLPLKPIDSFEDLTDRPEWVEELRRVYRTSAIRFSARYSSQVEMVDPA